MKKLIILAFLAPTLLKAQIEESNIEKYIDRIYAIQDQDINYEELYESLLLNLSNPINLNTASRSDLENLYLLNSSQIKSLLDYRDQQGQFLSKYELQSIPEIDLATVKSILPFVRVEEHKLKNPLKKDSRIYHKHT